MASTKAGDASGSMLTVEPPGSTMVIAARAIPATPDAGPPFSVTIPGRNANGAAGGLISRRHR